jgi:anti-anti-sigma factor
VVALSGELDLTAAATLREVMHPLFARYDADQVVLDVAALRFIDMGGVNALLSITRTFSSGRLRIVNAAPPVRRVLELAAVESAVVLDETW